MKREFIKKALFLLLFFLLFSTVGSAQESLPESESAPAIKTLDHSVFSEVLERYVDKRGLVNYRGLKRDKEAMARLESYIKDMVKIDGFKLEPIQEVEAYWLNLYNALVLNEVLKHYPIQTVAQIPKFFDGERYEVAAFPGQKLSFLDFEKKIFKDKLPDPRLHLLRVNASMSSAPLLREAYSGATFNQKAEAVVLAFLLDFSKNYYDPTRNIFYASPLFLWFDEDFRIWTASNRLFIQIRLPKLPRNFNLRFMGYDWKLNDEKFR